MVYSVMDSVLIDIYSIKDLSLVRFYDLTLTQKNRQIIVPALLISFDNGKYLNLTIKDKHFEIYVKKVIEVYQQEKDNVIQYGPFRSNGITIDKHSKMILENCNILNKKEVTSFYDDKDHYDNSLLFQSDEIKSIIDIIRYEIKSFGEFANLNMTLKDNIRGYRTNYVLEADINGLFTYLLITFNKVDDNHYQVSIGNLGGANNNFMIDISFTDNSIDIICCYKDLIFNDVFDINSKRASYLRRVMRNNKVIKFENGLLHKVDPKELNIINLDCDIKDFTWYELPWSSYLGHHETKEVVSDESTISTKHTIYLDINSDNFYRRDFYTKDVYSDSTASKIGITLTLDELRKITYGYQSGDYFIIETAFKDASGDGTYQEKFNGKYYYHIVKAKNIDEIKRDKLVSVRKEVINDNSDLLSDVKIKIMGGK